MNTYFSPGFFFAAQSADGAAARRFARNASLRFDQKRPRTKKESGGRIFSVFTNRAFPAVSGRRNGSRVKPAGFEESDFLGRRSASENPVAMRKPSEAPDDFIMFNSEGKVHRSRQARFEQHHRAFLNCEIFGMHERHIKEGALLRRVKEIETPAERLARDVERRCVLGESGRRVAIDIARELVEQNDQRERMARMRAPRVQPLRCSGAMKRAETLADPCIKRSVAAEPLERFCFVKPEGEDRFGGRGCRASCQERRH